jgi:hypothetical protein
MRAQGIMGHELVRHGMGQVRSQTPLDVDASEFFTFGRTAGRQLATLPL